MIAIGFTIAKATLGTAAGIALIFTASCGLIQQPSAPRDPSGTVTATFMAKPFDLEVGDCLALPDLLAAAKQPSNPRGVGTLPAVPCGDPHNAEVVGLVDPQPRDLLDQVAQQICADEFRVYSGMDPSQAGIEVMYLTSNARSGRADVPRVRCLAVSAPGIDGTLAKAGQ